MNCQWPSICFINQCLITNYAGPACMSCCCAGASVNSWVSTACRISTTNSHCLLYLCGLITAVRPSVHNLWKLTTTANLLSDFLSTSYASHNVQKPTKWVWQISADGIRDVLMRKESWFEEMFTGERSPASIGRCSLSGEVSWSW